LQASVETSFDAERTSSRATSVRYPQSQPQPEIAIMTSTPQMPPDAQSGQTVWDRVAAMDEFKDLMAAKARFIVPATLFFVIYYFALPVLVGFARPLMEVAVLGPVNIAYLFALSQFFMAWILAWLYMRAADRFDAQAKRILEKLGDLGTSQENK